MVGGSPPPSLLEATNNTTGRGGGTFTSQPDSSVCRESDWYVEQCLVLSLTGIYTIPVNILRLISMCTPISGHEHEVHMYKVVPSMACV